MHSELTHVDDAAPAGQWPQTAALPPDRRIDAVDLEALSVVPTDEPAGAAAGGGNSTTADGHSVQQAAFEFVTGPQATRIFQILPGLRKDQYLAPVILLQMDALRIRHRYRNGRDKFDRMLELFVSRFKQLSDLIATALRDGRDEFDTEAQLRCAERWVRSVIDGDIPREKLFDTVATLVPDPTGLQAGQWPTARMTMWVAIPLDIHTWPATLGDPEVVIPDWQTILRDNELEQGQTQAGPGETRLAPKPKNRRGQGGKRAKTDDTPAAAVGAASAHADTVTPQRVHGALLDKAPGRALARLLRPHLGQASWDDAVAVVADVVTPITPPPAGLLASLGADTVLPEIRSPLHALFLASDA
eukprot:1094211-Rhodomonas_salina.2